MSSLPDACPECGTEPGTGDSHSRAFVAYIPSPNDAQQDAEWSTELPELRGIVCTECGSVLGVVALDDLEDTGEAAPGAGTNDYRIDSDLT